MKPPKLKKLQAPKPRPENKQEDVISHYDERPEFRIEGKDLPQIKDWKVDEEYMLVVKVKMEGIRSRMDDGKEKTCGDFRIVSIGVAE